MLGYLELLLLEDMLPEILIYLIFMTRSYKSLKEILVHSVELHNSEYYNLLKFINKAFI